MTTARQPETSCVKPTSGPHARFTCFHLRQLGLREVNKVVGAHDGNGAGCDHQPLEHLRVQILAFFGGCVETLHSFAQQGLILENSRVTEDQT